MAGKPVVPLLLIILPFLLLLQALGASHFLGNLLKDEAGSTDAVAQHPDFERECDELLVWHRFYQLER